MSKTTSLILLSQIIYLGCDIPNDEIPPSDVKVEIEAFNLLDGNINNDGIVIDTLEAMSEFSTSNYDALEFKLAFSINSTYGDEDFKITISANETIMYSIDQDDISDYFNSYQYTDSFEDAKIYSSETLATGEADNLTIVYTIDVSDKWDLTNVKLTVYGRWNN